jgi:hypothetical protein
MILSYKYRIDPNQTQAAALDDMPGDFCQLYNAGLEQRIEAYRRQGISVTYKMQADELKAVRCAAPELARWSFSAEQQVLRREPLANCAVANALLPAASEAPGRGRSARPLSPNSRRMSLRSGAITCTSVPVNLLTDSVGSVSKTST